ncbi:acyltransferase [Bowmanella denitrificans]|uniref:acyltransferase n=1 Tax=Bowmanella denitrificans TaxID=366582 RepID=UPI000C9A3D57|nr:acyltransferase family protein [Bowmanella denitrificans]
MHNSPYSLSADQIRVFATMSVIVLHISANGVSRLPLDSSAWWLANLLDSASRVSIPLFVMLSGALLLIPPMPSIAGFYQKRVARIALPLLLWSLFYTGWTWLKGEVKQQPVSLNQLSENLLGGTPYFHLWYLFMLVGLYAATPLIRWLMLALKVSYAPSPSFYLASAVLTSTLYTLGFQWFGGNWPWPLWFIGYIPLFMLGAAMWGKPSNQGRVALLAAFLLMVVIIARLCHIQLSEFSQLQPIYSYQYLSLPVLAACVCAWYLLKRPHQKLAPFTRFIAPYCFGIYLVHPLFLDISQMLMAGLPVGNSAKMLVQIPLVFACSVLTCMVYRTASSKLFKPAFSS